MPVVVLAGGAATRLRDHIGQLPKCLVEFNGRPYLAWLTRYLDAWEVRDRFVVVNEAHRQALASYENGHLGEFIYLQGFPGDPLAHLVQTIVRCQLNVPFLVVNGNILPPPELDPTGLCLPGVGSVAASVALRSAHAECRHLFDIATRLHTVTARVVRITDRGAPRRPSERPLCYLGMACIRPDAVIAAWQSDPRPRQLMNVFATWSTHRRLAGCVCTSETLRFSTPNELRAAQHGFPAWQARLDAVVTTQAPHSS